MPGDCAVARGDAHAHARCAPSPAVGPGCLHRRARGRGSWSPACSGDPFPPPHRRGRRAASLLRLGRRPPRTHRQRAAGAVAPRSPPSAILPGCVRAGARGDRKGRFSPETGCFLKGSGVSASWDSNEPSLGGPSHDPWVPGWVGDPGQPRLSLAAFSRCFKETRFLDLGPAPGAQAWAWLGAGRPLLGLAPPPGAVLALPVHPQGLAWPGARAGCAEVSPEGCAGSVLGTDSQVQPGGSLGPGCFISPGTWGQLGREGPGLLCPCSPGWWALETGEPNQPPAGAETMENAEVTFEPLALPLPPQDGLPWEVPSPVLSGGPSLWRPPLESTARSLQECFCRTPGAPVHKSERKSSKHGVWSLFIHQRLIPQLLVGSALLW